MRPRLRRPDVTRRTAQRWISQLVGHGRINAIGAGRARRYLAAGGPGAASAGAARSTAPDGFPPHLPLSADSSDILAYIDRPLEARKPVDPQRFLPKR